MSDYSELKRLAEAATPGPWECREVDGLAAICHERGWIGDNESSDEQDVADSRFIAAANPAAVLALIAENERLKTLRSKTERDLEQELEVWRHGPSCWSCGDSGDVHRLDGEWLGKCDCLAAQLMDAARERDQLKAENAGLKTGYGAYETQNAALLKDLESHKRMLLNAAMSFGAVGEALGGEMDDDASELEGLARELRKDAERYRWLRNADWWRSPVCAISNPKEQAKLGSDCPSGERLDAQIDAAMSQGEQPEDGHQAGHKSAESIDPEGLEGGLQ